jgi:hypothetical protein
LRERISWIRKRKSFRFQAALIEGSILPPNAEPSLSQNYAT